MRWNSEKTGDNIKMNSICGIINFCKSELQKANKSASSKNFSQINRELEQEIGKIENAENEIAEYFKKGMETGNWEDERYWAIAAITHPSNVYLEYFFAIIATDNSLYPHWRILDVLAFMPKELHPIITENIKNTIDLCNPSWSKEDLKKAFEVIIWIGEEEDIQFIYQKCNSENKRIANMAKYWVEWLEEED